MGLAALALQSTEYFPTYPDVMDEASISAGLTLPYAAVALLGSGGAVATLLVVFMAVTSAFSAQLIAVSSILTYDIYGTYINPSASGRRLVYTSHVCVCGFGLVMAAFSTGLWYAGIRQVLSSHFPSFANALQYGMAIRLHGCHHLFSGPASDSYTDVERSKQVGSHLVSSFGIVLQHHHMARHHLQVE